MTATTKGMARAQRSAMTLDWQCIGVRRGSDAVCPIIMILFGFS